MHNLYTTSRRNKTSTNKAVKLTIFN